MAVSTMAYQIYNQKNTPQTNEQMAQQMKIMMYIMPIFLLVFFNNYSSGLSCYYFFHNVLSFGQSFIFNQYVIDHDQIAAKLRERKENPAARKQNRFQKRLQKMYEQQDQVKKNK